MPTEFESIFNTGFLYTVDNNNNMIEVGKLKNINLIQTNEINLKYKKHLKRVDNRNKLYNKLKKFGR